MGTLRLQYELVLHCSGHGSCTWWDFSIWGGACKHLRALWHLIDNWVERQLIHPFYYPSSQSEASQLVHAHTSQSKISDHTDIPPSFNNVIPSMLTSVLILHQLLGRNLPSEGGQDQDGSSQDTSMLSLSSEGATDSEISEKNNILVHIMATVSSNYWRLSKFSVIWLVIIQPMLLQYKYNNVWTM